MTDIMQVNQNVITYHIRHPSGLAYLIMRPPCRINAEIFKCLAISQSSESFLLLASAPPRIQGVEIFFKNPNNSWIIFISCLHELQR